MNYYAFFGVLGAFSVIATLIVGFVTVVRWIDDDEFPKRPAIGVAILILLDAIFIAIAAS